MKTETLIVKTATETLNIEIKTLTDLQSALNEDFINSVKNIFQNQGRCIITGIGKSAIVGQKIVATLNSTGTPSLFMHAADAIHGDLGMIQANDIVICISKSGDTPEIKVLVPLLKKAGTKLIAMVSNKASYLGTQADYILHTPIEREADPNNLAPTASTTAQMAMGDAVATSLLALRGFTAQDFAQYHPGGALGKQLYLRVSDIYKNHASPSVAPEATLHAVILEMTSKRLGATAVVDAQNRVLGIITDGDLRRMLSRKVDLSQVHASDIMSVSPSSVLPDELAVNALVTMQTKSIMQLLVVENEQYLGIVHLHDLLKEGLV